MIRDYWRISHVHFCEFLDYAQPENQNHTITIDQLLWHNSLDMMTNIKLTCYKHSWKVFVVWGRHIPWAVECPQRVGVWIQVIIWLPPCNLENLQKFLEAENLNTEPLHHINYIVPHGLCGKKYFSRTCLVSLCLSHWDILLKVCQKYKLVWLSINEWTPSDKFSSLWYALLLSEKWFLTKKIADLIIRYFVAKSPQMYLVISYHTVLHHDTLVTYSQTWLQCSCLVITFKCYNNTVSAWR